MWEAGEWAAAPGRYNKTYFKNHQMTTLILSFTWSTLFFDELESAGKASSLRSLKLAIPRCTGKLLGRK